MIDDDRVFRALTDVVDVSIIAPGMAEVTTWHDCYRVDARDGGCTCKDKQYNLDDGEMCKHELSALYADTDVPGPWGNTQRVATDGGAEVVEAVAECERIAVEAAVQNRSPLADFDEYSHAADAASEVA